MGAAEAGEVVVGCGLDFGRVEVAADETIAFSSAQIISEHLLGDAVELSVQPLVSTRPVGARDKGRISTSSDVTCSSAMVHRGASARWRSRT